MRIAVAAVACALVGAQPASAAIELTESTITSEGSSIRALVAEDLSGSANLVRLSKAHRRFPGEPETHFSIKDLGAGVANTPQGCRYETTYRQVECPYAAYDTIIVATGAGDDDVSSQLPLPNLRQKQILSSRTRVPPLHVFLGDGADGFMGPPHNRSSAAVFGESGRDEIVGGPGNELLHGGRGKDDVAGRGGKDVLFGGPGRDRLGGELGKGAILLGGKGRDLCMVSSRRDRVRGCERYQPF